MVARPSTAMAYQTSRTEAHVNTDFGVFRAIQLTVSFWGTNRDIYKLTQFFSKIQRSARIITMDVLFYPLRLTCVDCKPLYIKSNQLKIKGLVLFWWNKMIT